MISRIDHIVLTVADIQTSCDFYNRVLGLEIVSFAGGRQALRFGRQKINLHQAGKEFEPKAQHPTPGSADLCFICDTPLPVMQQHLAQQRVKIIEGPVQRTGASGPILSLYFRDPDNNLIEVAVEEPATARDGG